MIPHPLRSLPPRGDQALDGLRDCAWIPHARGSLPQEGGGQSLGTALRD